MTWFSTNCVIPMYNRCQNNVNFFVCAQIINFLLTAHLQSMALTRPRVQFLVSRWNSFLASFTGGQQSTYYEVIRYSAEMELNFFFCFCFCSTNLTLVFRFSVQGRKNIKDGRRQIQDIHDYAIGSLLQAQWDVPVNTTNNYYNRRLKPHTHTHLLGWVQFIFTPATERF